MIDDLGGAESTPRPPPEWTIWCPECLNYTAKVIKVDEYGDEILHCRVCKLTWIHP